jgi:hypothetical protein
VGGYNFDGTQFVEHHNLWCYNYLTDKWTVLSDVPPSFRRYHARMIVINDYLFIMVFPTVSSLTIWITDRCNVCMSEQGGSEARNSVLQTSIVRYSIVEKKWSHEMTWSLPFPLTKFQVHLWNGYYATSLLPPLSSASSPLSSIRERYQSIIIMGGVTTLTAETTNQIFAIRLCDRHTNNGYHYLHYHHIRHLFYLPLFPYRQISLTNPSLLSIVLSPDLRNEMNEYCKS